MDYVWHTGAWIDVLQLPVPAHVAADEHNQYQQQLAEYIDRCAMVLEDWNQRESQFLGDFRWGWVDYERQLAYLCLEVEGFLDLRLFVWVNDFAFAGSQTIHILAAHEPGQAYLQGQGKELILHRREDIIAQLNGGEP